MPNNLRAEKKCSLRKRSFAGSRFKEKLVEFFAFRNAAREVLLFKSAPELVVDKVSRRQHAAENDGLRDVKRKLAANEQAQAHSDD